LTDAEPSTWPGTLPLWVPVAAALVAGVLLPVVHPPVGARLLAFVLPAMLAVAAEGAVVAGRRPATLGFVAGLVGNLVLVHWISGRAGILAWLLLALVGAGWWALLAELLAAALRRRWSTLLAPLLWVGIDAWRGSWPFSGFGWGTIGVSQAGNGWLVPVARVLGEKGLTLVVVSMSLFAWVAIRDGLRTTGPEALDAGDTDSTRDPDVSTTPALRAATLGTGGLVVVVLAVTMVTVGPPASTGTIDVLAVQGNDLEFPTGPYLDDALVVASQALAATQASITADGPADLVVWPEGTVGIDPARDPAFQDVVERAGAVTDGRLLLGTDREDPDSTNLFRISAVVGPDGTQEQVYRKRTLVPFGEYVPFRSLIDWYPPLQQVPRDVLPGSEAMALRVGDVTVAIGICFESMYPEVLRSNILAGDEPAQVVVVSSADSSFGRSGQPAQHVDQSRLRAIETGRWVVHATTSGVTTLVAPDGSLHGGTDLFTVDTVRGEVGLATGLTPFLRWGDVLAPVTRLLVALAAAALVVANLTNRPRNAA